MQLVRDSKPITLRLRKDLLRSVKRGHAWLYSDAIELPRADAGSMAVLLDRKGDTPIASGIYDPEHAIPLRICLTQPPLRLDDAWLEAQLTRASELRQRALDAATTGYRLVAGEGDAIPGMIIDIYDRVAVLKLDGGGPESFYQPQGIAHWLMEQLRLQAVVLRSRARGSTGELLCGQLPANPVPFLEHGMRFTADVLQGQKTGFFLDQRDNRQLIRSISGGLRVLNLFSFSGGFSVAAGLGGAETVTSVDLARPAIEAAAAHWLTNELPEAKHTGHAQDCFEFLQEAAGRKETWSLVICDPPSFAPSEKAREKAFAAYGRLTQMAARVTCPCGLLAVASCSSHIDLPDFSAINAEALGKARRKAILLAERGLPIDHPTPLGMPELRYLKFQLFRLD